MIWLLEEKAGDKNSASASCIEGLRLFSCCWHGFPGIVRTWDLESDLGLSFCSAIHLLCHLKQIYLFNL